jgi:hypothetical protein
MMSIEGQVHSAGGESCILLEQAIFLPDQVGCFFSRAVSSVSLMLSRTAEVEISAHISADQGQKLCQNNVVLKEK